LATFWKLDLAKYILNFKVLQKIISIFSLQPVQIEPDHCYTALAVLDGAELSYFGQEGMTEVSVGSVTFQFQVNTTLTKI